MPTFKITNPQTGEVLRVTGDKPPTQQEAIEIFASRTQQPQQPQQQGLTATPVQEPEKQGILRNLMSGLGLGTTERNISTIGQYGLGQQKEETDQFGRQTSSNFELAQQLTEQAKQTSDREEKLRLLDRARKVMSGSEALTQGFEGNLDQRIQRAGITDKEIARGSEQFAARRGVGQTAELAAWAVPAKMAATTAARVGAGAATAPGIRIGQAAGRGAVSGFGQGLAGSTREAETYGEGALQTGIGTALGAGIGALFQTGVEGFNKLKSYTPVKATTTPKKDVSTKINETKKLAREKNFTNEDQMRALQFKKYKNKTSALTNDVESARIISDLEFKYNSTDQLPGQTQDLVGTIQDVKVATMQNQPGTIDTTNTAGIFKDSAGKTLGSKEAQVEKFYQAIIREYSEIDGLVGADPLPADKLARELGKQSSKYYYAARDARGTVVNPDYEQLNKAFSASKNYLRDQIDETFAKNITYTPELLNRINNVSEPLAKGIQNKTISMADLNYIQAKLLDAQYSALETRIANVGAGQAVLGSRNLLKIPGVDQLFGIANEALDVATSPLKSVIRTQAAKGLSNAPSLSSMAGSLAGKIGSAGAAPAAALSKAQTPIINVGMAAIDRAVSKYNKVREERKRLPQGRR